MVSLLCAGKACLGGASGAATECLANSEPNADQTACVCNAGSTGADNEACALCPAGSKCAGLPSPSPNSNSHGARPDHRIITMIKWFRTSRLSEVPLNRRRRGAGGVRRQLRAVRRQVGVRVQGGLPRAEQRHVRSVPYRPPLHRRRQPRRLPPGRALYRSWEELRVRGRLGG